MFVTFSSIFLHIICYVYNTNQPFKNDFIPNKITI